jgi:hypothetical protein
MPSLKGLGHVSQCGLQFRMQAEIVLHKRKLICTSGKCVCTNKNMFVQTEIGLYERKLVCTCGNSLVQAKSCLYERKIGLYADD